MELVDSHCHLFLPPLDRQVSAVLDRAREVGVTRVVVPAFDRASWVTMKTLAPHLGVHLALGLHPWVAAEDLDQAQLAAALQSTGAVAVGEIGLDFALPSPDRARQLRLLELQLEVAKELELPVLLHCRGAFAELIAALAPRAPLRGVVHAYSRGPELARRLLELGLHLAFGGAVTRPRAERARRSVTLIPAHRLLLETDAPAIGLEGVDPPAVEPCHLAIIAQSVADLRREPLAAVARSTTENARSLFGL